MIIQTWNAKDVLFNPKTNDLANRAPTVGIDIESRQSKAVLLHGDTIYAAITASDVDSQKTSERLLKRLLRESKVTPIAITS